MAQIRQLAAIMFTDIVGYTSMMEADEEKAFHLLALNRALQKPLIEKFQGTWVKELGDGVMAIFSSATDAVLCASGIQHGCTQQNEFQLRIGIHLGEVVFENSDVFGDGVNIAARLQAVASIGGILISEAVYRNIANKKEIQTKFLGLETLKNVRDPLPVYEVITDIERTPLRMELPTKFSKSLAVLPFADMSPSRDQEYLGDGLAEELINIFSQIRDLKVIGRTSSFSFKGSKTDLKKIGQLLNAAHILEGSVQKSGNRLRITAQLINAESGFHVWSQRYDREMDDIFALQDDICEKISQHLKVTLLQSQEISPEKRPTNNLDAYEYFLKADFYYKKYTEKSFEKAIEYLTLAVELDPRYADAWWCLGYAHFELHGWLHFEKERIEKAIYCAKKARAIDESNPNAHFLLALVHFNYDYNWAEVANEIALGNKYTNAPYSFFLPLEPWYRAMIFGDFDFAITEFQKGVESDPLALYYLFHLAQINLYGLRNYRQTRDILNQIVELGFPQKPTLRPLCLAFLFDNEFVQAEEYARKDYEAGGKGHGAANLIICLAAGGKEKEAAALYKQVNENLTPGQFPEFLHAKANAALKNMDQAFNYLDEAISKNNYWLFTLKYSPEWDVFRQDKRFEQIMQRMNFPG